MLVKYESKTQVLLQINDIWYRLFLIYACAGTHMLNVNWWNFNIIHLAQLADYEYQNSFFLQLRHLEENPPKTDFFRLSLLAPA